MATTDPQSTPRPTVVHLPDYQTGNPYQSLLAEGIRTAGWNLDFANYPRTRLPLFSVTRSHPDATALHLHWIHGYIERFFWSRSWLKFLNSSALLVCDMLFVRLSGRPIVWTVHNRVAHETQDLKRERLVRRLLSFTVNKLIFHSEGARQEFSEFIGRDLSHKSEIIPHGNYVGVYAEDTTVANRLRDEFQLPHASTVILFFGAIRRYKGVPTLVEAFSRTSDSSLRLIIAGKPLDQDIQDQLAQAASSDPRITLYLKMVPDEEVAPLFSLADAVAIPFERTLTSGSVLLAMTLGKALLLPETAKILGVIDARGAIFYRDEADMLSTLTGLQRQSLQAMGHFNTDRAAELDWQTIGRQVAALYR